MTNKEEFPRGYNVGEWSTKEILSQMDANMRNSYPLLWELLLLELKKRLKDDSKT